MSCEQCFPDAKKMSDSAPAISVLLSVRNGMPYLPTTITSIRAQTFRDFELVIVDNASTDDSVDFLRQLASEEPRLRLLLNERDLGHSGGLNRGLGECRGEWVARIDADDVALPERLERQLAFVRENSDVRLTSCLAFYIDAAGRRVGRTSHALKTREDFARYVADGTMFGILHPGVLMHRALAQELGGYREQFGAANDADLWCRFAERGNPILVQQEYLMEYRVHPGQISAQFMRARIQYEWARACARERRAGNPEPNWENFLASWNRAPLWTRLNRERKTRAKYFYRLAALNYACGSRARALVEMAAAAVLQPSYAVQRALAQRLD